MTGSYKSDGYSSISAYILADNAQRVIDFLKTTLAAEQLRRVENPEARSCMLKCESATRW